MGLNITDFINAVQQPARTYLWDVAIQNMPALTTFKAQTAQFPGIGSTDVDLFYQGQTIKYAGAAEYEHSWVLNVVESEIADIYDGLYAWRQQIWEQTSGISLPPSIYKKKIVVIGVSTVGVPWIRAQLNGAYPKLVDAVELDRSANTEAWKWNVTFSYDSWERLI